ncbi:hypothetical protein GGTG_06858 [Gaeumannomyces tritici R3-111a-1]|uniref:Hsp70-like protein n=1 Tax=Gaeumannomyces tritici (strain R3-111a-1) TaxID=644352 RepID=J3P011_GAET3|nr:hypothetical protein GGTG_06858 [Gaeumannomyces tritici R3-111a-1]EJT76944.1 hypothetical protein GGTG_06858 [Gaeumannomyces tritici R3-111a-1]
MFAEKNVAFISEWPGTRAEMAKTPSQIFYDGDKVLWGSEIPADADSLQWFKLLLLKKEDMSAELFSSEYLTRGREFLSKTGKSAVDVIADYLRLLWNHAIKTITIELGPLILKTKVFRAVITVPAIWKGYARQAMSEAAQKAGILDARLAGKTTLTFTSEPEAAALATLTEPKYEPKVGDTYIVMDAGGGTADTISYKIVGVNPIAMAEAVEGQGDLCGGFLIDKAIEDMCRDAIGNQWDASDIAARQKVLKQDWEQGIKTQFELEGDAEYPIWLPGEMTTKKRKRSSCDLATLPQVRGHCLYLPRHLIQKAFAHALGGIDKLVDQQIEQTRSRGCKVTAIILVGGLGSSRYIQQQLEDAHCESGILVLKSTGMRPRTAICRGAVLKSFRSCVTSTIARASLGVDSLDTFIKGKHLVEDKYWCEKELEHKANNQMKWFLKRGDDVSQKRPVKRSFYTLYTKSEFSGTYAVEILASEEPKPPSRKTADVKTMCTIKCTLDVDFHDLDTETNSQGEIFGVLKTEIAMVPVGASMEFTVSVNGRVQGEAGVAVNFQ